MATKNADDASTPDKAADKAADNAPTLDADAMSAPDQLEIQQLHNQRAEALARGDKKAVADIDAHLKAFGADPK